MPIASQSHCVGKFSDLPGLFLHDTPYTGTNIGRHSTEPSMEDKGTYGWSSPLRQPSRLKPLPGELVDGNVLRVGAFVIHQGIAPN